MPGKNLTEISARAGVHACAGIIIDHGKVLLVRRAKPPFQGTWICPGGKGFKNESAEMTVTRELFEEIGVQFKVKAIYEKQVTPQKTFYKFLGGYSGLIEINISEIMEFGWFDYKEAKRLSFGFDFENLIERLHRDHLLM